MENVNRKQKFPIAAIFFFVFAAWLLVGYIFRHQDYLDSIEHLAKWGDEQLFATIIAYTFQLLSFIPTLSYAFLGVALLLKKDNLIIIAFSVLTLTEVVIGCANICSFTQHYDAASNITIIILFIYWISKLSISNKSKLLWGSFSLGAFTFVELIYFFAAIIKNYYGQNYVWVPFLELIWIAIVVLAGVFFMLWTISPYKETNSAETCCETDLETPPNARISQNPPCYPKAAVAPWANDLLNLKMLLDTGVITQAEFDAKKHQFLGL